MQEPTVVLFEVLFDLRRNNGELTDRTDNDAVLVVRQKYSIKLIHVGRRNEGPQRVLSYGNDVTLNLMQFFP